MPPRTWRILFFAVPDIVFYGITSTYVENTDCIFGSTSRPKDHLHIRGEYNTSPSVYPAGLGSPPHTWRIQPVFTRYKVPNGITSTYVENTTWRRFEEKNPEDHLHIRGEYPRRACPIGKSPGSPPHTWRIPAQGMSNWQITGITSTYVENTFLFCLFVNVNKDHLHIRGEYELRFRLKNTSVGSPPHTWRIHIHLKSKCQNFGITSTYVENTRPNCNTAFSSQDHLHIRGEYINLSLIIMVQSGSPPHTWRIPLITMMMSLDSGITSTYVENTLHQSGAVRARQDHLHIRGEYESPKSGKRFTLGSPPHTWRILFYVTLNILGDRITSTYVENTSIWHP